MSRSAPTPDIMLSPPPGYEDTVRRARFRRRPAVIGGAMPTLLPLATPITAATRRFAFFQPLQIWRCAVLQCWLILTVMCGPQCASLCAAACAVWLKCFLLHSCVLFFCVLHCHVVCSADGRCLGALRSPQPLFVILFFRCVPRRNGLVCRGGASRPRFSVVPLVDTATGPFWVPTFGCFCCFAVFPLLSNAAPPLTMIGGAAPVCTAVLCFNTGAQQHCCAASRHTWEFFFFFFPFISPRLQPTSNLWHPLVAPSPASSLRSYSPYAQSCRRFWLSHKKQNSLAVWTPTATAVASAAGRH